MIFKNEMKSFFFEKTFLEAVNTRDIRFLKDYGDKSNTIFWEKETLWSHE
jgi:hypothetical protein